MPTISNKGKQMPASPIRRLVPYADKARARGIHIFHLNIGQPDIKTPDLLWDAMHNLDRDVLEYSPSGGFDEVRADYAKFLNNTRSGISIDMDDLLVTTGGSEALLFTMMSILDEGDEIIIPEPMYANYIGFARTGSIVIKPLTCHFDDRFSLPPSEQFEALITKKTKAILICNPNNPTGYVYTNKELLRLAEIAKEHDLFLIVDEVYREFIYDKDQHLSVLELPGLEQHAILIDSVSKRFSACGARIGAIVTKNKEVINACMKFAQQRLSPPTLAQIGSQAMFKTEASYFEAVHDEYILRRDFVVEALNNMAGVECNTPHGAFYTIARLPVEDSDHFCEWMLEFFDLHGETVMMAPASGFYQTEGQGRNEVRIAYVLNRHDLRRAMHCLEEGLRNYPGRNTEA